MLEQLELETLRQLRQSASVDARVRVQEPYVGLILPSVEGVGTTVTGSMPIER